MRTSLTTTAILSATLTVCGCSVAGIVRQNTEAIGRTNEVAQFGPALTNPLARATVGEPQ